MSAFYRKKNKNTVFLVTVRCIKISESLKMGVKKADITVSAFHEKYLRL